MGDGWLDDGGLHNPLIRHYFLGGWALMGYPWIPMICVDINMYIYIP